MLDNLSLAEVARRDTANPLDTLVKVRANWRQAQASARVAAKFATRLSGGPFLNAALLVHELYQRMYPRLSPEGQAFLVNEVGAQLLGSGRAPRWRPANSAAADVNIGPGWVEYSELLLETLSPGYLGRDSAGLFYDRDGSYGLPVGSWRDSTIRPNPPPGDPPVVGSALHLVSAMTANQAWPTGPDFPYPEEWLGVSRLWVYEGGTGPDVMVPGLALPAAYFGTPAPDPQPASKLLAKVGNIGLPGLAPATRPMTPYEARILHAWRLTLGLAESFEPEAATRREPAIDSVQVWPGRIRPGPPHVWTPAPPATREVKIRTLVPALLVKTVASAVTETGDFVENIWKAMDKKYRRAGLTKSFNRRIDSMLRDLWYGIHTVDWDKFAAYYEANRLEDLYYGATGLAATAAGARLRRGAGGFGMGQALGLHSYPGRPYGQGPREDDPISWNDVDPVGKAIDRYERWALESRARYRVARPQPKVRRRPVPWDGRIY